MHEQLTPQDLAYYMLYAAVAMQSLIACCYLLFRRGNAFAADVTTSVRLRRWTAAFFASVTLSHLWYLPTISPVINRDASLGGYLIGGLLDSLTVFPLAIVLPFVMLQDRKRPLWPVAVMVAPLVIGMVWGVIVQTNVVLQLLYIYLPLMAMGVVIYMIHEIRRYGRWLRDNFADLEHKEVWQSFVVLALIILLFGIYVFGPGWDSYEYIVQVCCAFMVAFLLWRVETLSDLNLLLSQPLPADEKAADTDVPEKDEPSSATNDKVGQLLQKRCVDTRLFLEHDLTLIHLAKVIGSNRSYLSQYFASQNTTYNAYINDLRIQHFIRLYHQTASDKLDFTVQQLASESGYRSYSTFSVAFKQRMGQTVSSWIRDTQNQD